MRKIAVVGAGPAGLTAAYALAKQGLDVEVFEAGEAVGGMSKTIPLWDQRVDLGPHRFFSSDPRVNRLWLETAEKDYLMVNRMTRIYYRAVFFDYPLKALNALRGLGVWEAFRCLLSYVSAKLFPPSDTSTFEGWVTSRFGARLFGIFFKSYSEKLWGISCKDLDANFAVQRIKKLSFFEAVKAAVMGNGGARHKTLVDEFAYPHSGTGCIYERMAQKIFQLGGKIHLNTVVSSAQPQSAANPLPLVIFPDGSSRAFDHVVSTMPITHLVEGMAPPESVRIHANALKFRNTILVYLRVDGASPFPDQWIYVHAGDLKTGRITNFRNWVPSINRGQEDTILCLEYWCYDSDDMWSRKDVDLVRLATQEIYQTGLVPCGKVKDGKVTRVPMCYPVYATGYRSHLKPVEEFLAGQQGITAIGRYGAFKYNNQDHSMLMGLLAAENIAQEADNNLWELNTDYEYQESSRITATGLSKS